MRSLQHVPGPLIGGGHEPPVGRRQLGVALPQGPGQPRGEEPDRHGNKRHRAHIGRQHAGHVPRRRRERGPHRSACNHPGTLHDDTQHVHRQGDARHGQALRRREEDAGQDDVKENHQRRDGLHAAQEMDDHGEHGQVDEDLQPQTPMGRHRRRRAVSRRHAASSGSPCWPGPERRQLPAARAAEAECPVAQAKDRPTMLPATRRASPRPPATATCRTTRHDAAGADHRPLLPAMPPAPGQPGAGRRRPASQWRLRWSRKFPQLAK